jgi:hypothetical protein
MTEGPDGYLLLIDQQQYGPYSLGELRAGVREGWARTDHLVWGPGLTDWVPIEQVPGLGGPAAPLPPPPQPTATRRRGPLLWVGCFLGCGVVVLALAVAAAFWLGWLNSPFTNGRQPEAYDFEAIYASDTGEWRRYPDRPAEEAAIAARQRELIRALRAGDLETAARFVVPEDREVWTARTRARPALTAALADALDTAEMSFLGVQPDIPDDPRSRTAGFVVTSGGHSFEIMWVKLDGAWYLYRY